MWIDFLLPFFGLKMELGPIAQWGFKLRRKPYKSRYSKKFETSVTINICYWRY